MNYKIKVTPENREAIKEIANRNGMNEIGFNFEGPKQIYHIEKGCFTSFPIPPKDPRNYQELTFDQFKDMFDKQETEPKEEWQPKRGEKVLVWFEKEEDAVERIFLSVIKEIKNCIVVVTNGYEEDFKANKTISISSYEHMKPIPIAPAEKTFKDKVIEVIEAEIKEGAYRLNYLLDKIKELN